LLTLVSIIAAFLLFGLLDAVRTSFAQAGQSANGAERLQIRLAQSVEEASLDQLTRVGNRGRFERTLRQWVRSHRTTGVPFVLAMVDVDDFKQINDSFGHLEGDRVLSEIARTLATGVRSTDTTSTGCSTTQITERSRRGSAQTGQSSSSVRFPHSRQKRTRSLTSSIERASAEASSFGTWRRWKASRWAVRVPTPGRRLSWATKLSTDGPNTASLCLAGSE
jgi:hypothetical protein